MVFHPYLNTQTVAWKRINEKYNRAITLMDMISKYFIPISLFSHRHTFTHIPLNQPRTSSYGQPSLNSLKEEQ